MDPSIVYERLAQFLVSDLPKSIEIIPGSEIQWSGTAVTNPHHPFLLFDGNLGIPQSVLYKTYIYAVKQLSHLPKPNRIQNSPPHRDEAELVSSTAIILLANPAHNTALNRRKQLMNLKSPLLTPQLELRYSAALLGNMKQASKSSILWHHRRWILRRIYAPTTLDTGSNQDDSDTLSRVPAPFEILAAEFDLTARASELYPRNYHAWLHRYHCIQCLISRRVSEGSTEAQALLQSELKNSQRWVELHVSDYTATQYLVCFTSALRDAGIDFSLSGLPSSMEDSPSFDTLPLRESPTVPHALSLISSYPVHESLWMYLRISTPIASGQNLPLRQWIINFTLSICDTFLRRGDEITKGKHGEPQALVERIVTETRSEDASRVHNYAIRLFIWTLVSNGSLSLRDALIERLRIGSELLGPEYLRELCTT